MSNLGQPVFNRFPVANQNLQAGFSVYSKCIVKNTRSF